MSASGISPLEEGIISRLRANVALMALVTGVYDAVPESGIAYPYVVFDEPTEVHDRTFGEDGHRINFSLYIYTQDGSADRAGRGSAGFKSGMAIVELIIADICNIANPPAVAGHTTSDCDFEAILANRQEDGITREIEIQMSAWLEH